MIPQLKEVVIEKEKWLTEDEVLQIIAIAESTPGPVAINMATYIGYKQKKILGSIFSTLGVVLPSLIIIFIISLFFEAFIANKYVSYAFIGIKCAVAFLIIKAGIEMIIKMNKKIFYIILLIITIALMIIFELFSINFSSIYLIIIGGFLGFLYNIITIKKGDENI